MGNSMGNSGKHTDSANGPTDTAVDISQLLLSEASRREIEAHGEEAYPGECCGLLVGRLDGDRYTVERVERCRNRRAGEADDRFEVEPQDYLDVDTRARNDGLEIIGVYHSHPDHVPRPSRFDAAAAFPGFAYLIVAVRSGRAAGMRSWLLELDGGFVEQDIHLLHS